MKRLTQSQISAGLLHPSRLVRDTVLNHFVDSPIQVPDIGRKVVQAIKEYGWHDAFYTAYQINKVSIGSSELPWAIDQLEQADELGLDLTLQHRIRQMIVGADVSALLQGAPRLVGHGALQVPIRFNEDFTYADRIAERVGAYEFSADECFDKLLGHCRDVGGVDAFADANTPAMERLVERIADGEFTRHSEVAGLLAQESEPRGAQEWIVGSMIQLAGRLRMEESAPAILQWFDLDWDWYNECISDALARIGTDAVVQLITRRYPGAPSYVRLYLQSVFEHLRTEAAASSLLGLIDSESDTDLLVDLGVAAASQFDTRTFDTARSIYLANEHHREAGEVRKRLIAVSHLMDIDFRERAAWEAEADRSERDFAEVLKAGNRSWHEESDDYYGADDDDPGWGNAPIHEPATSSFSPSTVVNEEPKVGRNEPCPCGSGRKYKKCCLKNV